MYVSRYAGHQTAPLVGTGHNYKLELTVKEEPLEIEDSKYYILILATKGSQIGVTFKTHR
jgi:hypothetical protein